MSKQPKILISHILDSIELIETYVRQISAEEFMASPQVQDAVIRRLEIIGEAAKNLRRDFWEMYPDLPWRQIAAMRDVLIHEYFAVDLKLTWNVIQRNLPTLRRRLKEILPNLQ